MVSPTFGMTAEGAPHLQMVTQFLQHTAEPVLASIQHRWSIAQWILLIAIIFLLVIDNTEYKSPLLIGLLVPLIFINAPDVIFRFFRDEPGHWIAVIVVLGILYTPPVYIPPPTNLWTSIVLLIVVAPHFFVAFRYNFWGILVSMIIAAFLATQHVTDAHSNDPDGPRGTFTQPRRVPTTVALIITIIIPIFFFFASLGWF